MTWDFENQNSLRMDKDKKTVKNYELKWIEDTFFQKKFKSITVK